MKQIHKRVYLESEDRAEIITKINDFVSDWVVKQQRSLGDILDIEGGSEAVQRTVKKISGATTDLEIISFKYIYYAVITVMIDEDSKNNGRSQQNSLLG